MTAKARITYFKDKFLEVRSLPLTSLTADSTMSEQVAIQHEKWDEFTTCFTATNVELPPNPFLGFSAHTGDVHGGSFLSTAV